MIITDVTKLADAYVVSWTVDDGAESGICFRLRNSEQWWCHSPAADEPGEVLEPEDVAKLEDALGPCSACSLSPEEWHAKDRAGTLPACTCLPSVATLGHNRPEEN